MTSQAMEFVTALRANEDFMKIPSYFFEQWKHVLGNTLTLEDAKDNSFQVSLAVRDNQAFFEKGILAITRHYHIPLGETVSVKYLGNDRFKFKIPMDREWQPPFPLNEDVYVKVKFPKRNGNIEMLWTSIFTKALATGRQAIGVPANVSSKLFMGKQTFEVRLDGGVKKTWGLIWTSTNQCRMGSGWYEFCKDLRPKKDDELRFTKYQNDDVIEVKYSTK